METVSNVLFETVFVISGQLPPAVRLSAVPTALSTAKRNAITQKNPTCMIDLLTTLYIDQRIPAIEEAQRLLQALLPESRGAKELFLISGALYNAGNSTPTLRTAGGSWPDMTKT